MGSDTIVVQPKLLRHKIPGTACLTGSSECREDCSNTCPKFTDDRMVGMYFKQLLLLQSEQSSHSTLVSQAFTHPCANRSRVAVTVHSSSRGEIIEKTDQLAPSIIRHE